MLRKAQVDSMELAMKQHAAPFLKYLEAAAKTYTHEIIEEGVGPKKRGEYADRAGTLRRLAEYIRDAGLGEE